MFTVYTFGPLRVILETETGEIVSVQDSLTGCAAAFLFTRQAIANATRQARLAWESTSDVFA